MTETPTHYARVFPDEGQPASELVAAYRDGVRLLRASVEGMDRAELTAHPIQGTMSALEVVGHVADCDQFLADRIKRAVSTDRPLLMGVDATRYLGPLDYQQRDLELQLALVEVTRAQLAGDLDLLPEEAWVRTGVHSEVGVLTVREMLLHAIRHLELHVAAIYQKREALGT